MKNSDDKRVKVVFNGCESGAIGKAGKISTYVIVQDVNSENEVRECLYRSGDIYGKTYEHISALQVIIK